MNDVAKRVAGELGLQTKQVRGALALLDEGNTVPFIARYRKERTGNLDEVQIRQVEESAASVRELEKRRASILETIADQGALDDGLRAEIERAETMSRLEDLYAPYKPKRRTRGQKAREAGLEPVAEAIVEGGDIDRLAREHTGEHYPTKSAVIDGAKDIIAEEIADDAQVRDRVRRAAKKKGKLTCRRRRGGEKDENFELYFNFSSSVKKVKPHQVLAIRRGENEKVLSAGIEVDDEALIGWISRNKNEATSARGRRLVDEAIEDGYKRLVHPAIERDVRGELEDAAEEHAIGVFAVNLKNLLLQAPLPDRRVLGIDPGYRTGCKMAVVGTTGELLDTGSFYVHDGRKEKAPGAIEQMFERHDVDVIAIGNGTGSRETEQAVADAIKRVDGETAYAMVDEAGASVYSASEIARREFPDLDVSVRGAVSIARRIQDPLAELVKIDPKSIGVGMYQHDVNQARLNASLDAVVEDVVNGVGVDLNSASEPLLARVAGIGPTLADRIVDYRSDKGRFVSRAELGEVRGVGAKTFEQCAGFLRIREGDEPLDATGIHPENYEVARAILDRVDVELGDESLADRLDELRSSGALEDLAQRHGVGKFTMQDIVDAICRPGRDPREAFDAPELRSDVLTMEDLEEGMRLTATVRNVVDFGAFVDIGVKHDGLVHISELADRYVDNPHDVVSVGEQIEVVVLSVDEDRGRIGLSRKQAQ
ncbi:MAG: Tex family protein [Persicimonas sp.]